jgi:hypothetical protein
VPSLVEFATIEASMGMSVIGKTPAGMRIDFPFEGTATSSHWEGGKPVNGIDYVTVRGDGHMDLEIKAVIGEGRNKIAYRATGVSLAGENNTATPQELITFQTADPEFAWLNERVGVGVGTGGGGSITLTVYLLEL